MKRFRLFSYRGAAGYQAVLCQALKVYFSYDKIYTAVFK